MTTNDSVSWYGRLTGTGNLTRVRKQSLLINIAGTVEYKNKRHLTLALLNLRLIRAGQEDFSRDAFAHLRYNYKLSKILIWEAYTQIQSSPIQLLQQRRLIGTGLRLRFFQSPNGRQHIHLGSSVMFEQNKFSEEPDWQGLYRSSNYFALALRTKNQFSIVSTAYWQPVLGLIKNYRFSSESVVSIKITRKLAFNTVFYYNIDKNLPANAPLETYGWRNGVTWEL